MRLKTQRSWLTLFTGLLLLSGTALFALGCSSDKDSASNEMGMGTAEDYAMVITTDYQTGSISTIHLADRRITKNLQTIHPDAVCRYDPITKRPFIVARNSSDAVEVIDQQNGWNVMKEYSVGAGSNPQDIAVVTAERAYIPRFNSATMAIVHPTQGQSLGTVDLSRFADPDGVPEMASAVQQQGLIYVAVQRLSNLNPTDYSSIVVINGQTSKVEAEVKLTGKNPYAKLRYNATLDRIVVGETGAFGKLDGGVEYLDPATRSVGGFVITEESLGGDLNDVVILSKTKGYALTSKSVDGNTFPTSVVSFNPTTGKKLADLAVGKSLEHAFLELTPDGSQLWVADRNPTAPGVIIFDTADDRLITDTPLDVGLPPSMICFMR